LSRDRRKGIGQTRPSQNASEIGETSPRPVKRRLR
jgi:hypothetical protein